MKLNNGVCALPLSLLTLSLYANNEKSLEHIEVLGTRAPMYDARDVNAAALGIKDPLQLPISIQSFSEQLIDNQLARTLSEVLSNDASVQNTSIGPVFDFVSLRGFQLDWNNGLRRDGLSLAPYQDVALENVQRIDVLKGPSGVIAGFNNPGGTVNYVTKRPTSEKFIELGAELNSSDGRYLSLDMGGPLSAQSDVGYRVNAAIEDNGDFTGGDDTERYFLSSAFDWQLNDQVLVRLDFDYHDKSIVSQPLIGLVYGENGQTFLPPYVDTQEVLLGQSWALYETETYNVGARVDYWLNDNWQWVNQVALSNNDRFTIFPDIYATSPEGEVLSAAILVTPDESFKARSGHSFLSGEVTTGFVRHELVVGVSYRDLESISGRWFELNNPVASLFEPVYTTRPEFPEIPDANLEKSRESAVFITDIMHFSDYVYATLGVRHLTYQRDKTAPGEQRVRTHDDSYTTPTLGINYNPNDALAFYGMYTEGAGEGGIAVIGSGAENEGQYLGAQESEQMEVGVKYRFNKATFSAAIYQIEKSLEYHNRATNYFVQDGVQRHRGIELNANGEIIENLSLVFSTSFMDAEIRELAGQAAINGNPPHNVPNTQGNLFVDYNFASLKGLSGLSANIGVFYVGERQQNLQNSLSLPSYTRFDTGVRYDFSDLNLMLRFKVENLFDKEYWVSAGAKGMDWGVAPGNGRLVSLSANYTF